MLKRAGILLLTFVVGFLTALPLYLGLHYLFGLADIEPYHVRWGRALHDVTAIVLGLMLSSAVFRRVFGPRTRNGKGTSPIRHPPDSPEIP